MSQYEGAAEEAYRAYAASLNYRGSERDAHALLVWATAQGTGSVGGRGRQAHG
jgi:hypothetical protein